GGGGGGGVGLGGLLRLGDPSSHGGVMITASGPDNTMDHGVDCCVEGDLHACPIEGHGVTPVSPTFFTVITNGIIQLHGGDIAGCGAILFSTTPDVWEGPKPG